MELALFIGYKKELSEDNGVKKKHRNEADLCFPSPQQSGTCDSVDTKGKGTHPKIAIVRLAHVLDVMKSSSHVPPKLPVHLIFFPHETLNILQNWKNLVSC